MSKNQKLPLQNLKNKSRSAFIGKVESAYLEGAIDKMAAPLHPNFATALRAKRTNPDVPTATEQMHNRIRSAVTAARDLEGASIKQICIVAGRQLNDDARSYVQYWKEVVRNCAFAAHMDCNTLERAIDPKLLDEGLDAMQVTHGVEDDIPAFDLADIQHAAPREEYAGETREPIASSVEEAEDAVKCIQAWVSLAFNGMNPNSQAFWGLTQGAPLDQEVRVGATGENDYVPIYDFAAYREHQKVTWNTKRKSGGFNPTTESLMAE